MSAAIDLYVAALGGTSAACMLAYTARASLHACSPSCVMYAL